MYFICSKEKYDYISLKKIIELNTKTFVNIKLVDVVILSNYDELLVYLKKDIEKVKDIRNRKTKLELKIMNNNGILYNFFSKEKDEINLKNIEKEFKIQHLDVLKIKNFKHTYFDSIDNYNDKYISNKIPYRIKYLFGYREYPNTNTDSHFFVLLCNNERFESIISRFNDNLFLKVLKNDIENKDITINLQNNFINNKNYEYILNNKKTSYKDDSYFYITEMCIESVNNNKQYFINLNDKNNVVIINKEEIINKIKSNLLYIDIDELHINNNCGLAKTIE